VTDLRAAILARCDELERIAKATKSPFYQLGYTGSWEPEKPGDRPSSGPSAVPTGVMVWDGDDGMALCQRDTVAAHVAAWDPASVLALVSGARGMVAEHPTEANSNGSLYCVPCDDAGMQTGNVQFSGFPCTTMFLLARMLGVKADG
jgi:hypothetical protein